MFTASAACRAARPAKETLGNEIRRYIRLENLSRTILPTDIERALRRERLVGVEDVQMQLFRFLPTRQAYITLTHPDLLQMNMAKLRNMSIGGHAVTAIPCLEPPTVENLRGVKGRKSAFERGSLPALTSSGALSNGRQVCTWGFPPKASVECVKDFLGHNEIDILVNLQADQFSLYSRYLIRTPFISDSYRIARRIHQTLFRPDRFGTKFQVRACVVR
ncbi:hypothetical protein EV363DRAFT_1395731 [Boletus edulis]|nr:hypothetical protein EV363DRAFT_1395731 [Boletus edulis]